MKEKDTPRIEVRKLPKKNGTSLDEGGRADPRRKAKNRRQCRIVPEKRRGTLRAARREKRDSLPVVLLNGRNKEKRSPGDRGQEDHGKARF